MDFPGEPLHDIEIREMTLDDVPAVTVLDRAAGPNPWTEDIFRRELQISISRTLVAVGRQEQGDQIAGFITFGWWQTRCSSIKSLSDGNIKGRASPENSFRL